MPSPLGSRRFGSRTRPTVTVRLLETKIARSSFGDPLAAGRWILIVRRLSTSALTRLAQSGGMSQPQTPGQELRRGDGERVGSAKKDDGEQADR